MEKIPAQGTPGWEVGGRGRTPRYGISLGSVSWTTLVECMPALGRLLIPGRKKRWESQMHKELFQSVPDLDTRWRQFSLACPAKASQGSSSAKVSPSQVETLAVLCAEIVGSHCSFSSTSQKVSFEAGSTFILNLFSKKTVGSEERDLAFLGFT